MAKTRIAYLTIAIAYLTIAIGLSMVLTAPSWALRCGTRIISIGDSKDKVEYACGEPSTIDSWEEEQVRHHPYYEPFWNGRRYEQRVYYRPLTVYVAVDRWTYNYGSTRFLQHLIFKNGILKKIDIGEKGF